MLLTNLSFVEQNEVISFTFVHSTDIVVEECNRDRGSNLRSEIYLSNMESEKNYIRRFLSGKQLRVASIEVSVYKVQKSISRYIEYSSDFRFNLACKLGDWRYVTRLFDWFDWLKVIMFLFWKIIVDIASIMAKYKLWLTTIE